MDDGDWFFRSFGVKFDLGYAADVAGGNDFGSGGVEIGDFALAEDLGCIRMFDIVTASGTAADFPFRWFEQGDSRDRLEKSSGSRAYLLGVG